MCRLLVADDEPWVRRLIVERIPWAAIGVGDVRAVEDGIQALELALSWHPDVILADIVMPGLDGLELVRRLHESGQRPRVVLLSGYSEFEYARTAVRLGCDDYLLKPVQLDELEATLRRAVRAASREEAAPSTGGGSGSGCGPGPGAAAAARRTPAALAAQIRQYVDEHYAEALSLEGVARRFYLHPNSLSRLFRRELGITFQAYLRRVRLQHARAFLAAGRPPAEVGPLVGYPDPAHFSRVFKRATGVTPGAYRRGELCRAGGGPCCPAVPPPGSGATRSGSGMVEEEVHDFCPSRCLDDGTKIVLARPQERYPPSRFPR